jgi:hypothetical protein
MSRFRMYPTPLQERQMLLHCAHARYVWVRREVASFKTSFLMACSTGPADTAQRVMNRSSLCDFPRRLADHAS